MFTVPSRVNEKIKLRGNELGHDQADAWSNRCVGLRMHHEGGLVERIPVERGTGWSAWKLGNLFIQYQTSSFGHQGSIIAIVHACQLRHRAPHDKSQKCSQRLEYVPQPPHMNYH